MNWKTTTAGIVTAAAGFVAFSPELFVHLPVIVALSKYALAGGLASIGIFAKDHSN